MRTQLIEITEPTDGPGSRLRQNMPKEGANLMVNQGRLEPASTISIGARRSGEPGCPHHWIIEFAAGPLSKGACRLCGAKNVFRNHLRWSEITPVRCADAARPSALKTNRASWETEGVPIKVTQVWEGG